MPFQKPGLPNFHFIDAKNVALDSPLVYVGKRQTFTVPRGFVSDFATIPKFLWWLLGPTGKYTAAAILHDYFCKLLWMRNSPVTGRDADGLFRRTCRELGVDPLSRYLLWTGVRWGALFNERRREGWWRDLPLVAAFSVVALVPVGLATVGIVIAYLILLPIRWIAIWVEMT